MRLCSWILAAGCMTACVANAAITRVGAVNWDCSLPSSTFFGHYATQSLGLDRSPYAPGTVPDLQRPRWTGNPEILRRTPAAEIMYGPLLLAKSTRVGDDEAQMLDPGTVGGGGWSVALEPREAPDVVWAAWTMVLEKDGRRKRVGVCDFPSAAEWKGEKTNSAFSSDDEHPVYCHVGGLGAEVSGRGRRSERL